MDGGETRGGERERERKMWWAIKGRTNQREMNRLEEWKENEEEKERERKRIVVQDVNKSCFIVSSLTQ